MESNLLKIHDTCYVLRECLKTQIDDRKATINLLKIGLRVCNTWFYSHNYYVRQEQDMDRLENSRACYYSYTASDVAKDPVLREIVSLKFLLCIKLKRMQFYNKVLTAGRSLSGFNVEEFNLYSQSTAYNLALRFTENGEDVYLNKLISTFPQCILPYRYDIVSHFPLVTDPSKYVHFLPAFDASQGQRESGVFVCWSDDKIWEINTLNDAEVEWFEKKDVLLLLDVEAGYKSIVQEFITAYEDVKTESVHQSDYALFVSWVLERCKQIDDSTGLTNLSKELIKQALELTSSYQSTSSYNELLQLDNQIDLLCLYLDNLFVINPTTDILNSSNQITLSQWLKLDLHQMMERLFACAGNQFVKMIQLLTTSGLVQLKDISGYILESIRQDPKNINLFVDYLRYFKSTVLPSALSDDLSEFSDFFQAILLSDFFVADSESINASFEVSSALLESALLPSSHHKQIEAISRLLHLYKQLYAVLPSLKLLQLQTILTEDDKWFELNSLDLENASLEMIDTVLNRPIVRLIREAATVLLKQMTADKVITTIRSLFPVYLPSLPKGIANYILLPLMLKEKSANARNIASDLTSCVKQEWMNLTVLRGVDEEIKSMNEYR